MKFTLSWLKQFLDTDANLDTITSTLTHIGLEVEEVIDQSKDLASFEVAEIIDTKPHPDANKLQICSVQTKSEILQIICGAPNARQGIKVVLAPIGSVIPNGDFKIKQQKIRGQDSFGMLCSADELKIGHDSDGIIELDNDATIGESFVRYAGLDDPVIHINVTPNRADALGVYGIARDLAAAKIGTLKDIETSVISENFDSSIKVKSITQDCPLFAIRELKNIKNCESPRWLQKLLTSIGISSISAIVDITNYICFTFGQPMHAYDAQKFYGNIVIDNNSTDIEFLALDEKEYKLINNDIVVKDNKNILCLAGIIGGKSSACSSNTTNIILEAAIFGANQVAKTSQRLGINTDSKHRFERHVDPCFTLNALDLATNLIKEICGSDSTYISAVNLDKLGEINRRNINFNINFLHSYAGIHLTQETIINILTSLCYVCKSLSDQEIDITVPSFRNDVSSKEDIVEEILRIYGYDNIPEIRFAGQKFQSLLTEEQNRISSMKRILAAKGYHEVVTWSFMDSKKAKLFNKIYDELRLLNPISSDLDYMRPSIIPNLLSAAKRNINRSMKDLSLFEIGCVFKKDQEYQFASGIRTGLNIAKNCHETSREYDVFDIKSDISHICGLDISKFKINTDNVPSYYHPSRSATLMLGKNIIGYFGQIHPMILKEFDIEQNVVAFEINVMNIPFSRIKHGKRGEYIASDYQLIERDYAFIIDKEHPVGDMIQYIYNVDKSRIKSVNIFDIYEGDKIEESKKSIALSVIIQDNNKTLNQDEITKIHETIINGIEKQFGASLRAVVKTS